MLFNYENLYHPDPVLKTFECGISTTGYIYFTVLHFFTQRYIILPYSSGGRCTLISSEPREL